MCCVGQVELSGTRRAVARKKRWVPLGPIPVSESEMLVVGMSQPLGLKHHQPPCPDPQDMPIGTGGCEEVTFLAALVGNVNIAAVDPELVKVCSNSA